ncbi:dehydrogenase [Nocardioides sp. Soil797]|nr:dehydrogenase [Nocardioides sp. Soil797]
MSGKVAVVGGGVAGLVAAHAISRTAQVTLFEADPRLGGHADTHVVDGLGIDTGFIVHNERTYPTLLRLFAELGVETQPSDMSMSVRDLGTGLEYAGAMGPRGLFPTMANLGRPAYLRMLVEIPRFHRRARRLLASTADDGTTLRDFLDAGGFSAYFTRHFMEPLVAAVWSCDPETSLDYPARYLFAFLEHHGMLGVFGSPRWRTVTGGSAAYVAKVAAGLHEVRTGTKVTSVEETPDGVVVTDGNGLVSTFDAAVIATHPGQALSLLSAPTTEQRDVLGAMPYSRNTARLHTDTSLLPRAVRARASWNFLRPATPSGEVTVTYDLTRLQSLPTETRHLVTLGGADLIDPATVVETMEYEHPLYTPESVAAQRRLPSINTARIAFAGAYHGWGFHEDGAASGVRAAEHLGFTWDDTGAAADPTGPAAAAGRVFRTRVRHERRGPLRHGFTNRSWAWLVDLDDLPRPRVAASFEARDHVGEPAASIRTNLDDLLAARGIDLHGGRILMLANPRAFGHCFNPLSVFWCHDRSGEQVCVVLEVHNTYGERHAYVVRPDEHGHADVDKAMYVSPFNDTSGRYEVSVTPPGEQIAVSVTLRRPGHATFTASVTGEALPAGRRPWRAALAPLLTTVLIRVQGIGLWLRRLPVQPRPRSENR